MRFIILLFSNFPLKMCAKTTAAACSSFKEHRMWLNGEEVPFEENPRIMRCLKACKF